MSLEVLQCPAWTRSCAACCRWPCFGRRVGLDDPQRSLPIPTILWFCDSVNEKTIILKFSLCERKNLSILWCYAPIPVAFSQSWNSQLCTVLGFGDFLRDAGSLVWVLYSSLPCEGMRPKAEPAPVLSVYCLHYDIIWSHCLAVLQEMLKDWAFYPSVPVNGTFL